MQEQLLKAIPDNSPLSGAQIHKDGVHFGYTAKSDHIPVLVLYKKGSLIPEREIPFPENPWMDGFYSMKLKIRSSEYEYNIREGNILYTDPYASSLVNLAETDEHNIPDSAADKKAMNPHSLRGALESSFFNWKEDKLPELRYADALMYHLHVRQFTAGANSGVRKKGTFAGLKEKLPYLKKLGVNQLCLMPVYEYDELVTDEDQPSAFLKGRELKNEAEKKKSAPTVQSTAREMRKDCWGYRGGAYFALKKSYSWGNSPENEFKDLVRACHLDKMEVILNFFFPDSCSFAMIFDCLTFWSRMYHVDGFHVMARPQVCEELVRMPLFRHRKLICSWFDQGLKEQNAKNYKCALAELNDGFMYDARGALRSEASMLGGFAFHLRNNDKNCAQINYITNHDGFTLNDLVSYEQKRNQDNGENNLDGSDYNMSWNCGIEGPTKKKSINELRIRQEKNALAMLLLSQGTPMLRAGDEHCNSQQGNNNPFCLDNEISWLDWNKNARAKEVQSFTEKMIAFRKNHPMLHQGRSLYCADMLSNGYPDISYHGSQAWYGNTDGAHRHLGIMLCGEYASEKGFLYIACNFDWEEREFALPVLPPEMKWVKTIDTSLKESFLKKDETVTVETPLVAAAPRSILVLEGC